MTHPVTPQGASRRSAISKAILTIVGIALFFGFVTLGTWQVQRRAWKLDLMERVETRLHQPPVSVAQLLAAEPAAELGEKHAYQPVFAEGRWLADKTVFTQALTELGAGFWTLTPLETASGQVVLVNRGFVPEGQRASAQPPEPTQGTVRVEGLLRSAEPDGGFLRKNDAANGKWYSRDVAAIGQAQGLANVQPFFIDQGIPQGAHVNADTPTPANAMQGPWPRSGMTVVKFHNSHTVYILTWYGLALMVLGAAWLVVRHERKRV
ncbi:SURF1 family protein [Diaphorobacter caeni]|uniref:SURF1 family protein n=1 Tax=Diaphorobacter caeni TaxID=2784387 RepID=UPI001E617A89|nr:SURF1 family protein [Diaphorobacter caeni]